MEEPIQQQTLASEQQQQPEQHGNYAITHDTAQLQEQITVQEQEQQQQGQLLLHYEQQQQQGQQPAQHLVTHGDAIQKSENLYSRCNASREDLLNMQHLSRTRNMSIYDLCPMCLDLGQLMQVGHHDSAMMFVQPHPSIQYQQGHIYYEGGEGGQVSAGIASVDHMDPSAIQSLDGATAANSNVSVGQLPQGYQYQYQTHYLEQPTYDSQQQEQQQQQQQQQQDPLYYAALPEGAEFGQIYVDQNGNQIVFQPAPQYQVPSEPQDAQLGQIYIDENGNHYQYQYQYEYEYQVDPNQQIEYQQQPQDASYIPEQPPLPPGPPQY